jgi:hypothetical protein
MCERSLARSMDFDFVCGVDQGTENDTFAGYEPGSASPRHPDTSLTKHWIAESAS